MTSIIYRKPVKVFLLSMFFFILFVASMAGYEILMENPELLKIVLIGLAMIFISIIVIYRDNVLNFIAAYPTFSYIVMAILLALLLTHIMMCAIEYFNNLQ